MTSRAMSWRLLLAGVVSWLAAGCSFGVGSAYVNQWRERDVVEFEVCLEDATGRCEVREQVTRHQPERSFWGVIATPLPLGRVSVNANDGDFGSLDYSFSGLHLEPSLEYLRGRGRFAVGARVSFRVSMEGPVVRFTSVPVMAMGHIGLAERFSVYGGLGYAPRSSISIPESEDRPAIRDTSRLGGRALFGLQFEGARYRGEHSVVWTLELDRMWVDFGDFTVQSSSIVGSLGAYF